MAEILVVYQGPTFKDLVELMSSAGAAGFFLQDFFKGQIEIKESGWWFQPLWKILVSWDDYSQYMGKKCSK